MANKAIFVSFHERSKACITLFMWGSKYKGFINVQSKLWSLHKCAKKIAPHIFKAILLSSAYLWINSDFTLHMKRDIVSGTKKSSEIAIFIPLTYNFLEHLYFRNVYIIVKTFRNLNILGDDTFKGSIFACYRKPQGLQLALWIGPKGTVSARFKVVLSCTLINVLCIEWGVWWRLMGLWKFDICRFVWIRICPGLGLMSGLQLNTCSILSPFFQVREGRFH